MLIVYSHYALSGNLLVLRIRPCTLTFGDFIATSEVTILSIGSGKWNVVLNIPGFYFICYITLSAPCLVIQSQPYLQNHILCSLASCGLIIGCLLYDIFITGSLGHCSGIIMFPVPCLWSKCMDTFWIFQNFEFQHILWIQFSFSPFEFFWCGEFLYPSHPREPPFVRWFPKLSR